MERVTMKLSKSQSNLVKVFEVWMKSQSKVFTISGDAGTGKTFMVNYLINKFLKDFRVVVSAPTHKAVKVISAHTGLKGKTIHSLHGLRPNFNIENFNVDTVKFDTIAANKFEDYDYVIMDEASMIGKDLKTLNDLRIEEYGTKVIYCGDEKQLLPVKSSSISDIFKVSNIFKLTDIVRQEENHPLLKLFPMLRADVANGTSTFLQYIGKNHSDIKGDIGYSVLTGYQFQVEILKKMTSKEYKGNIDFARYAAYTNDSVKSWNLYIRTKLFNNPKDIVVKGDLLLGYKTIIDENMSPVIINSEDYKIKDVLEQVSYDGFKIFACNIVQLGKNKEISVNIVDHTDLSFVKFYKKLYELHQNALFAKQNVKAKTWRAYFDYKNEYLCMVNFDLMSNTNQRRATIQKDIDYAYGVSIHKLQGSTIENIFLNLTDVCFYRGNKKTPRRNTPNQPDAIDTRNRLLYTGISRASKMAYLLY